MNRSRTIISAFASLALGSLMASPALGALSASPNPSTTGSYTVSGSVSTTRTYGWVSLIETAPGGTTADFDVADAGNISEAFSGKAVGTYTYQVQGCRYDLDEANPERQEPIVICENIGASLSVSVVSPPPADPMPDFGTATVAAKSWAQNSAISAFTVPAATGGDAPLSYTAKGLPTGVSMSSSRSVSGTPGTAGMGTATVTVSDKDGDTDTLSFAWTVAADLMPTFGTSSVSARSWTQNSAITAFTVPAATGGDGTLTYTASGLPAGVSMSSARSVSGTPTAHGTGSATVTVRDADGDTAMLEFDWSVAEDLVPDFGTASVSYQSWAQNSAITAFTVPAATGGDGTLQYSISGLPAGLSMSGSREVSGTPTASGVGAATVTVRDADGDTDTLRFSWYVGADRTPTFGTATIADKTFKQNASITAFYVPIASGGNWPLSYSATGLPAGVSLANNRRVSGTPTAHGMGSATVTVTDSDGDTDMLEFDWTVNEDLSPSFGTASVADKDWTLRTRIAAFTVPAASGGDGTLRYSVSGLPSGVWMSTSTRQVSGRPLGNDAGSGTATVTVRDADGDTATLEFDWSVDDPMPDFGEAAVSDKTWTRNSAIPRFTAPAATGGNTPVRYAASDLPDGVTMSSLRRFSGTPTATGSGTASVTARDADGDTDALTFDWTVQQEDLMPTFGSTVAAKRWLRQAAIATFTVPAATGGDAPLSYSATGLPAGVTMSSARAVSGTPRTLGSGTATVTVTDNDGDTDTVSFDWLVYQMIDPPLPPAHKKWLKDQPITGFTVPGASGGVAPLTYSISGLPAGLSMSSSRRVSGTPTANGSGTATVTITDANSDTDTVSFTWNVELDTEPSFGSASVSAKRWEPNSAISRFTVPGATGGNSPLSYTVRGLPAGVAMSSSRRVSGTPTATGSGTAIVTVTDFDGDTDTLRFNWTVAQDLTPTFTGSVSGQKWVKGVSIATTGRLTVPAATGGDAPLSYSVRGLPAGVTMSGTRRISGTPTATGTGTATVTVTDNDGDTDTLTFDWNVQADTEPTFGSATSVPTKTWAPNQAITAFTMPVATGGNAPLSYTVTGLPNGVSMSKTTRRISGTPAAIGSGTATVTVTDCDGDTDSLRFNWSVEREDLMPRFGTASVGPQGWTANQAITAFTVPAASGGDGTVTYSATGLPYGVKMSSARQVSGTPLFASSGTATVTVRDADGDTDTLIFDWAVAATDLMPNYSSASVAQPSWARDQAIVGFTVPAASGGNTPLSYRASGLPAGITMSAARALSGTPTRVGTGTATVTVTDADRDTASFTFGWAVVANDSMPTFGSATIPIQAWVTDKAITALTAVSATGGNAPLVHGIHGLPKGVVMLDSMQIEGTPTAAGSGTATVAARDADGDITKVSFNWTVTVNSKPSFGTSVSNQSWTAGQAISALTVPSASGGNGTLSYGASGLPEGVTLSPTLQLSGTPLATGSGTATVSARDTDGDTATLTFNWSATLPDGTGTVLSVSPSPTTNANYTVSGAYTGTRSYIYFRLLETNPWGDVTPFHHASVPFDQAITNRVDGAYSYRLEGCYLKQYQNFPEAYEVCETVGDTLSVTVDGPDPDPVGTQLGYTFQARVNSTNPALATAILIDRTSSATGGGVFQDIVLRKSGKAFELVEPDSVTGPAPGTWPTSTAVDVVLNDINLDGFVDVLVRGLGGAITGALDQIVYAPGRTGGSPVILNAVDSTLTNFLSEVSSWTRNPAYFDNAMESVSVTRYRLARACWEDEVVSENLERYCGWVRRPYTITVKRPSNSSSEAREFARQFTVANGKINPDISPNSVEARNIDRIVSGVLGTEVLGGHLDSSCQDTAALSFDAIAEWCKNIIEISIDILVKLNLVKRDIDDLPPPGRELTPSEKPFLRKYGPPETGEYRIDSLRIATPSELGIEDISATAAVFNREGLRKFRNKTGIDGTHIIVWNEDGYQMDGFTSIDDLSRLVHESVHVCERECEGWTSTPRNVLSESELLRGEHEYYRENNGPVHNAHYDHLYDEEQAYLAGDRARLDNGLDPVHDENIRKVNGNAVSRQEMLDEINCVEGFYEIPAVPKNCG